jgi:hypothetical protein
LSWKLLFSLRSVVGIVVEIAMETSSEAAMDTALGAAVEIVEYMLALLLVEMILLPSALQMKGFCSGLLGFCVLVVRSRQVVVGRDETCGSVEKVLDGAVFELPDAVVVWSKARVTLSNVGREGSVKRSSSLHRVAHGKRVQTEKERFASLDCCKFDCQRLERLVFPLHAESILSVQSLSLFPFLIPHHDFFVFF